MRGRATALVLLGIGAFLVVVATALPTVLAPALVKLPLTQEARSSASGTGLTIFYPGDLSEHSNVTVSSVRKIAGLAGAPEAGPDTAVWTVGNVLEDSEGVLVGVTEITACFDRRTGVAVNPCPSARLNGDDRVRYEGQLFAFPFGTEQHDYEFFDPNAQRAFPIRFMGVESIEGIEVYRFQQDIPEIVTGTQEVPGELAGAAPGSTVEADLVYQNTRTLWVEPTTGSIMNGREEIHQVMRGPGGTEGVTLLDGTLNFTPEAITTIAGQVSAGKSQVDLITRTLPIALGIAGAAALIAGLILLLRAPARPVAPARRSADADVTEPHVRQVS